MLRDYLFTQETIRISPESVKTDANKCDDLNEKNPPRFWFLNIWLLLNGTVWGLGGLAGGSKSVEVGIENLKPHAISKLFSLPQADG